MSSSINVYAAPLDRLRRVLGSGDRAVIDAIAIAQAGFLASVDDIDEEAEIKCADAVGHLVNGAIDADAPSYLYGYALEALCAHFGKTLPNICPITRASQWIEAVDALLGRAGIPVRLATLVFAGSPVPIPEPDEYPFIGRWPADTIAEALAAFRSFDGAGVDRDMAETLSLLRAWLEAAAQSPGASVIGFLS